MVKKKVSSGGGSNIMDRLRKNTTIKDTDILGTTSLFDGNDVATSVPMLNVALSGDPDKGFLSGQTQFAGPSKHFKTGYMLIMIKAYLEKYKDGVCLFYDNEFGAPQSYFETFGIDTSRVLHTPIDTIEELKFDIIQQIDGMSKKDKVIICIDSIGNVASKKEMEDALTQNSKIDMTRAKALKALFRMVTPKIARKDIPLITINHSYKEIGAMYPTTIISGGTGSYYGANSLFLVGRRSNKNGREIESHDFVLRVVKSRYVKEDSRIPITISFDKGINKYSGLFDFAVVSGHITSVKQGWYNQVNKKTGTIDTEHTMRKKEIDSPAFWEKMMENKEFKKDLIAHYTLGSRSIFDNEVLDSTPEIIMKNNGDNV